MIKKLGMIGRYFGFRILFATVLCSSWLLQNASGQEFKHDDETTMENGIRLDQPWPPQNPVWQRRKEMSVPYLSNPPAIITINVGRQLFVDNFLIDSTNLIHKDHIPNYYDKNPVLEPTKEWEYNSDGPYAMPFSDGVWYDEKDNKYKMWYLTGAGIHKQGLRTAYAESLDGVHWKKPDIRIYGNTNIVDTIRRDACSIWLDRNEKDSLKRFKMFIIHANKDDLWPMVLKYSPDGIHWTKGIAQSGGLYDRSTVFYNPFLAKWVLSMKTESPIGRARCYMENKNPETLVSLAHKIDFHSKDKNIVFWFGSDGKGVRNPKFPHVQPQVYNFDAIAYESLMIGFFTIWTGPPNSVCDSLHIQKRNEVYISYSRDGFHWYRPSHRPFAAVNRITDTTWNWGNVQSVIGSPIINDSLLYFYVSGRRLSRYSWDSYTSTGLLKLRRDGFVSMDTKGDKEGYLITRTLSFNGKYLFINADVKGSLKVEVLDSKGHVIKGYGRKDCRPLKGNHTRWMITWKNRGDLKNLRGKPVRFRFFIRKGELYSFWVSYWKSGESNGYTAGGGPGLNSSGIDVPVKMRE